VSRFYRSDPDDPDAPIQLERYSHLHGVIRPGDACEYVNPQAPPLPGPLVITELWAFGTDVLAILNDGEYETSADNLRALPPAPDPTPEANQ
jgi:hypothetical protein